MLIIDTLGLGEEPVRESLATLTAGTPTQLLLNRLLRRVDRQG